MTRKTFAQPIAALLCLTALLGGCGKAPSATNPITAPTETVHTATPEPSSEPSPTPTPEPTPEPTPAGVYPADIYAYFAKVGFSGMQGETPAVAKWNEPIRIQAFGLPNDGDRKTLAALVGAVKGIRGVPEISYVTAGGNLFLYFLPKDEAAKTVDGYSGAENTYFVADWNASAPRAGLLITDEMADRAQRDAALASLFFRALGLQQDGDGQYADSVLSTGSGSVLPSERDIKMLKLLYCPELTPGMAAEQAMATVPSLNPDTSAPLALTAQAKLSYFNEVGFYWAEGARDGIVSKWTEPIALEIQGEPTAAQQAALDSIVARLSQIDGFPGISVVGSGGNMIIWFAQRSEISKDYPQMAETEMSAWKPTRAKNGVISACRIGAAADQSDETQSVSQFLRVMIWSLGLNFTSTTMPDSILNLSASAQTWSESDWAALETLYRADVKPGAKRAAVMDLLNTTK